jgi:hypothetical protein
MDSSRDSRGIEGQNVSSAKLVMMMVTELEDKVQ